MHEASDAASIFSNYLARLEDGDDVDFESICREHPELEAELRAFQASWNQLGPVLRSALPSGSIAKRIRELHGKGVDPGVELEPDDHESPDFSSEVLRRLSEHAGGFGRYRLRGEVARGGQGAVLRVWDEDLRRNLAMKVILGSGEESSGDTPDVDPKTLGRFLEEAQVTGQLDHPGIVPVHELGLDAEGRVYFTMKLVKGQTLREVFDKVHRSEDGWTVTRALGLLLKVCEAMSYAHAKHVIHRDLKPANIMVGRFGEVYVMDWGLARVMGREDPKDIRIQVPSTSQSVVRSERRGRAGDTPDSPLVTMDGDVVGTPAYMSPEQAKGQLALVGPPSDVYSVGAMLYHLLSGQMPYVPPDGRLNNYAVWQRAQEGPPRPLRDLATAPPELEAVCDRSMARDLSRRYKSISELGDDIRAYLEGRVVAAYETGAWAEARKWVQRNKLAASIMVLGVLSSAGLVMLLRTHRQLEQERLRHEEAALTSDAPGLDAARDALISRVSRRVRNDAHETKDVYRLIRSCFRWGHDAFPIQRRTHAQAEFWIQPQLPASFDSELAVLASISARTPDGELIDRTHRLWIGSRVSERRGFNNEGLSLVIGLDKAGAGLQEILGSVEFLFVKRPDLVPVGTFKDLSREEYDRITRDRGLGDGFSFQMNPALVLIVEDNDVELPIAIEGPTAQRYSDAIDVEAWKVEALKEAAGGFATDMREVGADVALALLLPHSELMIPIRATIALPKEAVVLGWHLGTLKEHFFGFEPEAGDWAIRFAVDPRGIYFAGKGTASAGFAAVSEEQAFLLLYFSREHFDQLRDQRKTLELSHDEEIARTVPGTFAYGVTARQVPLCDLKIVDPPATR